MQATATGRLHAKRRARHSGDPPKERQSLPRFCNPRGQTPLMHEAQRHIWKHHQSRRSASKGSAPFGPAHRPRGTLGRERDPPWRFTAHDLSHGRGCGYAKHQPPTPHLPAQPPLPLPFRRGLTPSDQRTARESPSAGSATRLGASPHTIFLRQRPRFCQAPTPNTTPPSTPSLPLHVRRGQTPLTHSASIGTPSNIATGLHASKASDPGKAEARHPPTTLRRNAALPRASFFRSARAA